MLAAANLRHICKLLGGRMLPTHSIPDALLPPTSCVQNDPLLATLSPASLLDLTRMMAFRLSTLAQVGE